MTAQQANGVTSEKAKARIKNNNNIFAKALQKWRNANRLPRRSIGEMLGKSDEQVRRWENSENKMDVGTFMLLVQSFPEGADLVQELLGSLGITIEEYPDIFTQIFNQRMHSITDEIVKAVVDERITEVRAELKEEIRHHARAA